MSTLKSVIITLPAKGLANKQKPQQQTQQQTASKLNFTTSILVDKIKAENGEKPTAVIKHMEAVQQQQPFGCNGVVLKQEIINNNATSAMRGKKRRLDHLTWEEKLQRKKLKNRVAAQTSRDRKKARLDELEETVKALRDHNESLLEECAMLRTQNESLLEESQRLREERETRVAREDEERQVCSMCQARVGCTVPTLGSAVSCDDPLQQGGTVQTASALTLRRQTSATILLKILTLYLLSRTYSASSKETATTTTSTDSKSLPKAFCERLPLKWKQVLLSQMNRIPSKKKTSRNLTIQKKWWGRHQVMWKPRQIVKA